jgi:site-specific DNA recombinase
MKRVKAAAAAVTVAVGYVRVSTQEQADSGLSLAAQRTRIEAQALANGWELAAVFEDAGLSAKTLDRPGLRAALAALTPGRVLLALKLDRLTRSVRDLYELTDRIEQAGAEWACVQERFDTTTASGRLMLNLIVQLSQWEREVIGERTAAALSTKRVRRERLGATPLGFVTVTTDDGGRRVDVDDGGAETVRLARQWRAEGLSLRAVAARLTAQGRPTKRGGRWQAATVARLLETRYLETIAA